MKAYLRKTAETVYTRRKLLLSAAFIFILIGVSKLFSYAFSEQIEKKPEDADSSQYAVFSLSLPGNLNFCSEAVPLTDIAVRENLEKELLIHTYSQPQTFLLQKRANRWFPVILPILKKHGIPEDFKYLALVESGFTNVVSPMGAAGFWQIIPSTAEAYGLEMNDEVDERYHVEKATHAACKMLKESFKKFNNWTLVAASFNLGMGGIERALEKQKAKSYYDLYLNEETARYVFRVLALKEIMSRPESYGFKIRKKDLYTPIPVKNIKVDSSINDLAVFAENNGVSYKTLKMFNPWLRKPSLINPEKKIYYIQLPLSNKKYLGMNEMELLALDPILSLDTMLVKKDTTAKILPAVSEAEKQ